MSVIDTASRADAQVPMQPQHDHDLGAVQREAFSMIGRGVADRRHAFHTPVLVTLSSTARYTRVSNGLIRRTQSPLDRLTLEVVPPA